MNHLVKNVCFLFFLYSLFEFQSDGWSFLSLQYVLGQKVTSLEILPLQLVG